ncbi:hypothetical protein KEM60_01831 [Austwickia sp. TVS 96-490-7B]|uniref:hypothetical protein n=1 Tax=Austwickia sp. TVS 96-490-7B TaxID=2830843 RepID=UPI001C586942|nr:hypothetical protein [Austwickia sp. TVS 96-490-7B]MBW3085628.1 hypothetical protein [Austwickia sp. TVS 96-490-7B]
MKSRLISFGAMAALSAVFAVATTGCTAPTPGTAASVDGLVIHESDLASVIQDLSHSPQAGNVNLQSLLGRLILAKVVEGHAKELDSPEISVDTARSQLKMKDASGNEIALSDATVNVGRALARLKAVADSPKAPQLKNLVSKATIVVNPKYGKYDMTTFNLVPGAPDWIVEPSAPPFDPTRPEGPNQPGQPVQPVQPRPTNPATLPGAKAPGADHTPPADKTPGADKTPATPPADGATSTAPADEPSGSAPDESSAP